MPRTARKVLGDCKIILEMMEKESNADRLRVLWIGSLALLRMVGHVLYKVDAEDPIISARLDHCWPKFKSHPIFDKFINDSRNRALKEYSLDLYDESTVVVVSTDENGRELPKLFNNCMFMPLLDGFMAGEDGRDVYRGAIDWWDSVLTEVESA